MLRLDSYGRWRQIKPTRCCLYIIKTLVPEMEISDQFKETHPLAITLGLRLKDMKKLWVWTFGSNPIFSYLSQFRGHFRA